MNEWLYKALYLLRFICFMAAFYLALHLFVAPRIRDPRSKVAAFFTILTSPLVRPVRALLPPGRTEQQVRAITLAVLVALWLSLALLSALLGARLS
jgi:uncharacterized protein YggT (Ycf19 family)